MEVEIFTRGICTEYHVGGYAAIWTDKDHRLELSGGYHDTTNNRMDMVAAINGLQALKVRCKVKLYNKNT